jgi:hypothetical protein
MEVKISKFIKDTEEPMCCDACPDEMNGTNFGTIEINKLKININICDKCLKKLKEKK